MQLKFNRTVALMGSAILLLIVVVVAWLSYGGVHGRSIGLGVTPDRNYYPVKGIDISAHNGIVDFAQVKADSVAFVYIKATEGTDFKDRRFVDNVRRARKAGLPVGAYHFFRFDSPGRLQAYNLMHSIRLRNLDLPPVIDVEEFSNPSNYSTESVSRRLKEMIDVLEQFGYTPIIFTNKDGYERFVKVQHSSRTLWISSFTNPPLGDGHPWTLWQHSHRGRINGVSGFVDVNTFNGSRREFDSWLKSLKGGASSSN